ncbi:MAG: competence/damage-inducible protein A [Verrucomicrobia bacterium]|nr:competence/damage-inducible protein A [Verrucomicrobiota bacterium]MBV8376788.1 competence/damage-inducible protein A [Verrucomicrobiota bacterium]
MSSVARVEVLNTGTELLFGSVINTHLSFLAQQLFPIGLRVQRQSTVPDGDSIRDAIEEAATRCDAILVTGGLGPTSDDITREIVAELTGRPLRYDDSIFQKISERFKKRGLKMTDRTARQAYVPEGATVLPNDCGTAPGMYIPERNGIPHLFLFPGPPRELRPMFKTYALPLLRSLAGTHDLHARTYRTTGMGESQVERMIGDRLLAIPGLELGYCARMGEVDVRVIGPRSAVAAAAELIEAELGPCILTTEEKELEEVVVELLTATKATLAIAESCTGGLLASRITDVPGASVVFIEGNVTYSNDAKTRILGVPAELFSTVGAVSEEVARAMAEGALQRSGATNALSTTGVAGPGGGTDQKPVGTVFIGLASRGSATLIEQEFFPTDRSSFKRICTQHALEMLRRKILFPS